MDEKPIVVIGSINMDLVCRTPAMPKPGETILGKELTAIPGGKGANQAVAAARLAGAGPVHLVGRVGDDAYGQTLLQSLTSNAVQTEHVTRASGIGSGVAVILLEDGGENSIVVIPGANQKLSSDDIDRADDLLRRASVVIMQLEVPPETIEYAISRCRHYGAKIILDPAPAPVNGLPAAFFDVHIITPNQSEAEHLLRALGGPKLDNHANVKSIGEALLAQGSQRVVLKLGGEGAMIVGEGDAQFIPSFKVKVVDTTAAGDAFTAAMGVALTEGMPLARAVRFANAAGALACTKFGAQPSLPSRDAVDRLLAAG